MCFPEGEVGSRSLEDKPVFNGLPSGSDDKESASNAEDLGVIPGWGRSPRERNGNPAPVFLPGEFHGQRRLAGYSPWGCKELDTTEPLTLTNYTVEKAPTVGSGLCPEPFTLTQRLFLIL